MLGLLVLGCAEGEAPVVTARFALETPAATGTGALRDQHGFYRLEAYPAFVELAVTPAATPVTVTEQWPATESEYVGGAADIELVLEVDTGTHTVDAVAFVAREDGLVTFAADAAQTVELGSGTTELDLTLHSVATATVAGAAGAEVAEVWLVHTPTRVRLARQVPVDGTYEFPDAPANVSLALAWVDGNNNLTWDAADTFTLTAQTGTYSRDLP